jgi:hypothetical protein
VGACVPGVAALDRSCTTAALWHARHCGSAACSSKLDTSTIEPQKPTHSLVATGALPHLVYWDFAGQLLH